MANSEIYANLYDANEALTASQSAGSDELQIAYEYESHRAELLEEEAAKKREEEGWWNALAAVGTIVVGAVAIVCTAGMATPVVVTGVVAGSCTIAYGASNLTEVGQDIYYGANGDATTVAINPIRDTVFAGNQELYDIWGGISTAVAGFVVPVGQAYTAAKTAGQITKEVVGTVVKATLKEVGQDALVNKVSLGTGSAVMDMTGDANVSRLFSMGAGFFVGGRTNQALDSLDNVSSTVRTLDNLDTVTDVTRTLDDVTDSTRTLDDVTDGTKNVKDIAGEVKPKTKAEILAENRRKGRAFELEKLNEFKQTADNVEEQITIITNDGTKIRIDAIGNGSSTGKLILQEYKSSDTARLTHNQVKGFPELEANGGVVVGNGKGVFVGGVEIPPGTIVDIIRPIN